MQVIFLDSKPISHLVKPPQSHLGTKTTEKSHLKIADSPSVGPNATLCFGFAQTNSTYEAYWTGVATQVEVAH
jgi:hypothetical protein